MRRKLLGILMGAMLLSGVFVAVDAKAYTAHNRNEAVEWAIAQVGKALDYDGAYGAQCVDLIKYYYAYLGEKPVRGNGKDYATNALPGGWSRIQYYYGFVPEPGDIAVWTTGGGGYGHVAIITYADENGFRSIDQNIAGTTGCVAMSRSYSNLWGVVRPDFPDTELMNGEIYVPEYEPGEAILAGMVVTPAAESGMEYQWLAYDTVKESWSLVSDWSESNWVSWKPEGYGIYWLHCYARNAEGEEVSDTIVIAYREPEFSAVGIYVPEYEPGAPVLAGMAVTPADEIGVQYQWLVYDTEKGSWSLVSNWSDSNWVSWQPEKQGTYWLHCYAKNAKNKEVSSTVIVTYQGPEFSAVGIYVPEYEPGAPVLAGMVVTPSDEVGVQYQWLAYDTKNESWSLVSDWSDSNWVSWQPEKGGDYWLHCYAKNQKGEIVFNTVSMHYDTCE